MGEKNTNIISSTYVGLGIGDLFLKKRRKNDYYSDQRSIHFTNTNITKYSIIGLLDNTYVSLILFGHHLLMTDAGLI